MVNQLVSTIELENVSRVYKLGSEQIYALDDINLKLNSGQLVVILGPSGSGKTTLLNILGGIDHCTGRITVGSDVITSFKKKQLTEYRRKKCGFIFQFFNLLPIYNASENVQYAVALAQPKISKKQLTLKSDNYLKKVGLYEKRNHFPSQLSGGEQQRVAAARAFAKEPLLLLCDEPTGELSVKEGKQVLSVIQKMVKDIPNLLVVLVTHNQKIAEIANIVIRLRSGKIDSITTQEESLAIDQLSW